MKYVGDFETSTWETSETWVWAWSLCEIGDDENVVIGNSIESFFEYIEKNNSTIYFHNLRSKI